VSPQKVPEEDVKTFSRTRLSASGIEEKSQIVDPPFRHGRTQEREVDIPDGDITQMLPGRIVEFDNRRYEAWKLPAFSSVEIVFQPLQDGPLIEVLAVDFELTD
jgi:hypothetical protein